MGRAWLAVLIAADVMAALQARPQGSIRWRAPTPIHVWVDSRTAPPGADALVDRALATWNAAADGRLELRRDPARGEAGIRVRFAQADGVYGETMPRIDRATGFIASADVIIAGDPGGDPTQQRIVIYLTALHELGHALGLPHTDAFEDIMYSFRRADDGPRYFGAYRRQLRSTADIGSERATGLSTADVAALRLLYRD
jgi:hypothetical protein